MNQTQVTSSKEPRLRLIWAIGLVLALIGVVTVVIRTRFLIPVLEGNYEPTPIREGIPHFPEAKFVQNPLLTLIHILPALLYVTLGLLQFVKPIRAKKPHLHRWNGRFLVVIGMIVGISGIVMGFRMAISGVAETAATTLFGTFFLFSLTKAFIHVRRKEIALHREWMIRAFAIGLAVTTTRPIVGIFFATSPLTGLTPQDFFGAALWIGWTLHLIGAEVWINRTRGSTRA